MSSPHPNSADASGPEATIEGAIEHAKRAFALKKFEQAVEHYATALELMTTKFGEDAPETADLYFTYGKALLENAISQSSVLGKEQPEEDRKDDASSSRVNGDAPILSFSGDAEDFDGGEEDDPAVDLFAQAAQTIADAEATGGGDDEDDDEDEGEPEDDFNAAWEVLDLARAIYEKQQEGDDDDEIRLKLADTLIALGDVSLETEKFDQAITDYEAGLALKVQLLPTSSRQVAEAHYKLSMVLDLTSGRLSDAIIHAEKAFESVETRLAELKLGLLGQLAPPPEAKEDVKGKGKLTGGRLVRDDLVQSMSKPQIEAEIKELSELKEDLALKVEELKTSPNESLESTAPALVAQSLDKELNGSVAAPLNNTPAIVNDLTSMVVKKKKIPEDASMVAKRKADSDAEASSSDKKARLEILNP